MIHGRLFFAFRCQDIDNLMRLCKFHRGGESNAAECPSATSIEQEMLDLDFNVGFLIKLYFK